MVGLTNEVIIEMAVNLSNLFTHNVNIIDTKGIIIGSGDSTRIGDYHPQAYSIINDGSTNYEICESEDPLIHGGIIVPLNAKGSIFGVAEINGNPETIGVFSNILKMTLESLISQKVIEGKKKSVKHYEREVVLDVLYGLEAFEDIDKRLDVIGFKKMDFNLLVKVDSDYLGAKCIFKGTSFLKAEEHDETYFILTSNDEFILRGIKDELVDKGINSIISEIVEFNILKDEFQIIKYIEKNNKDNSAIYHTKNFKIKAFLETINYDRYDFYEAKNIMSHSYLIETFYAYIENNLSLIHTSEKLFIHLNTLKYRLKRIEAMTGCSLHNIDDIVKIRLSIISFTRKGNSTTN